jgi:hypothetical protein
MDFLSFKDVKPILLFYLCGVKGIQINMPKAYPPSVTCIGAKGGIQFRLPFPTLPSKEWFC